MSELDRHINVVILDKKINLPSQHDNLIYNQLTNLIDLDLLLALGVVQ